jgi:hypothetical protein
VNASQRGGRSHSVTEGGRVGQLGDFSGELEQIGLGLHEERGAGQDAVDAEGGERCAEVGGGRMGEFTPTSMSRQSAIRQFRESWLRKSLAITARKPGPGGAGRQGGHEAGEMACPRLPCSKHPRACSKMSEPAGRRSVVPTGSHIPESSGNRAAGDNKVTTHHIPGVRPLPGTTGGSQ